MKPPRLVPSDPANLAVKDFVYISRSKVEKLYEQLPKSWLSGIAAKLNIIHPPVTIELRKRAIPKSLYVKLAAVLRHLERESGIGSLEKPTKYFAGQLPLYWGPYSDLRGRSGLVFFGGFTRSTVLGLGGSLKHVLGQKPKNKIHSRSDTPWLMDALLFDAEGKRLFPPAHNSSIRRMDYEVSLQAVEVAVRETERQRRPAEMMEFVAIKLAAGRVTGEWDRPWANQPRTQKRVLLGSPIYVARA